MLVISTRRVWGHCWAVGHRNQSWRENDCRLSFLLFSCQTGRRWPVDLFILWKGRDWNSEGGESTNNLLLFEITWKCHLQRLFLSSHWLQIKLVVLRIGCLPFYCSARLFKFGCVVWQRRCSTEESSGRDCALSLKSWAVRWSLLRLTMRPAWHLQKCSKWVLTSSTSEGKGLNRSEQKSPHFLNSI